MALDEPTRDYSSQVMDRETRVSNPSTLDDRAIDDRQLLFGLLARQTGFIGHDTLVDAVHAWAVDKQKPLGSILRDWGSLDDGQLAALTLLVAEHLKKHGVDAIRTLENVDRTASTHSLFDLIREFDDQFTSPFVSSNPARSGSITEHGDRPACRYRKPDRQPYAGGGLGEVFIADDLELGRKVALKEIRAQNAFDEQSRARFLLEGEVTGNLEHPGIVPVYGLGIYDDGRPFYAMRFIRGKNLKDTITEFRAEQARIDDPGEKALGLRKLLRRFIDVCNAIEYAHSRGVLHRDIKPANIMLGKFGETLVVDWGLAKIRGHLTEEGSTLDLDPGDGPLLASSSTDVEPTRKGPIGTLNYMSPEQAAGKIEELGPWSDVCGLGATLYYVLTGHAPFPDGDPSKVIAGTFRKPRELDPEVPRPLEAICLKAMATNPADRYRSALALAEDLERWLGDQPVVAYRDPLPVRLARWSRRNRSMVATAATLLVAAVLGLAISNVVVARERSNTEKARQDAVATLVLIGETLQRLMVGVVVDRLAEVPGTVPVRNALAEEAIAIAREFTRRWPNDPVVAVVAAPTFHLTANLDRSLGRFDRALASYRDATRLYDRAIAANLPGQAQLRANAVRVALDHAEAARMAGRRDEALMLYDEARRRIDANRQDYPGDVAADKALGRFCYNKAAVLAISGRLAEARNLFDEAIPLLESVAQAAPNDSDVHLILTFPLLGRAVVARDQGRLDDAGPAFDRALAHLDRLESSVNVRFLRARVLNERGRWLAKLPGRLDDARKVQEESVEIHKSVVRDFSSFPQFRLRLAVALIDRGLLSAGLGEARRVEALEDGRSARELLEGLLKESPRMIEVRGRLGEALGLIGSLEADRDQARGLLERALAEQAQAIRDEPGNIRDQAALERHQNALKSLERP